MPFDLLLIEQYFKHFTPSTPPTSKSNTLFTGFLYIPVLFRRVPMIFRIYKQYVIDTSCLCRFLISSFYSRLKCAENYPKNLSIVLLFHNIIACKRVFNFRRNGWKFLVSLLIVNTKVQNL